MTLKETFSNLRSDLHDLKAAAQAHNVASYEPPTNSPSSSKPEEGTPGTSTPSTSDKLSSTPPISTTAIQGSPDAAGIQSKPATVTTTQPSSDATVVQSEPIATQQAYVPPPPPPKNLPHGWTARYDNQEGKFSYSHGVNSKNEQWDFRNKSLSLSFIPEETAPFERQLILNSSASEKLN